MTYTRALGTALAIGIVLIPATAASGAPSVLRQAEAPVAQLERDSSHVPAPGSTVTHYGQVVGGVPVSGADVVVTDVAGAGPEILFDKSVAGLDDPGAPAVSRSDAVAAALAAIGSPSGGTRSAELVIDSARGNQLAWEVVYYDRRPISDWLVTVSASTGDVIAREDRLRRGQSGEASLFTPNPVVTKGSYGGLRDRGDRDSDKLTAQRVPVTLEDLKNGQSCLKGKWAVARFMPKAKQVCKASLDWTNTKRASNRFEALMAYYHVTEAQQYIQGLGLTPINQERQKLIANSIPEDNSFYSPGADEIQLGTGGVDDGEDADVIVHEYGHAVQDAQNPGAYTGQQGGAMGEGFGDYLAAAYSTETAGFDPEWTPCIMEWDATSYDDEVEPGICLRRADVADNLTAHQAFCGTFTDPNQIHCMGEVWSSALLDLRSALGNDIGGHSVVDRILLDSHFSTPNSATFEEGAEAVIVSDEAIYQAGDHCTELRAEFVARELLPGSFTCS